MSIKNLLLLSTVLLITNVFYCLSQQKFNYDNLKVKKYADLTIEEQKFFKMELTKKLRTEPLVGEINKLQKSLVKDMMQAAGNRTPEQRAKLKENPRNLTPTDQLRLLGIEHPDKYLSDQNNFKLKTQQLVAKYPELSKVDRVTLNQIFIDSEKSVIKGRN
jgi:hypothetical protein